ncbi:MAG: heavy-metal-associated domain-containing protein [Pirellulaceae bacterium]|nr:heavy-metal-associated domain-containing protein [Pirellulaceae bacterium]
MRRFALGMLFGSSLLLGCTPPVAAPVTPTRPASGSAPSSGTTSSAAERSSNVKLVSMKVDMHCPFGCYPKVKETLEAIAGVENVELAEQKKEGEIDNPKVYIKLNGDFNASVAIAALKKEGFESEVTQ